MNFSFILLYITLNIIFAKRKLENEELSFYYNYKYYLDVNWISSLSYLEITFLHNSDSIKFIQLIPFKAEFKKNGNYIETNLTINGLNIKDSIIPQRGDLILTKDKLIIYISKDIQTLKNGVIIGNSIYTGAINFVPENYPATITFYVDCHTRLLYNDLGNYDTLYFGETLSGYKNIEIELQSRYPIYYTPPKIGLAASSLTKAEDVKVLFNCEFSSPYYYFKCKLVSYEKVQWKSFMLLEIIPGCKNGLLISNSIFYILNENDTFNENGTLIKYKSQVNPTVTVYNEPKKKKKKMAAWKIIVIIISILIFIFIICCFCGGIPCPGGSYGSGTGGGGGNNKKVIIGFVAVKSTTVVTKS